MAYPSAVNSERFPYEYVHLDLLYNFHKNSPAQKALIPLRYSYIVCLSVISTCVYVCPYSWCMCHYQAGIMQYLEHSLTKCATIV